MKPVFLIGFMGAGKSTVGKKLASALEIDFLDMDTLFEERYHMSIPVFFDKFGEGLFRKFEQEILISSCALKDVLISTGGGTPCNNHSIQLMRQHGLILYLSMPPAALVSRLISAKRKRPLIFGKSEDELLEYVTAKLEERSHFYNQAHLIADGINVNIESLAAKIQEYPDSVSPVS
jgi:shikimate kinase